MRVPTGLQARPRDWRKVRGRFNFRVFPGCPSRSAGARGADRAPRRWALALVLAFWGVATVLGQEGRSSVQNGDNEAASRQADMLDLAVKLAGRFDATEKAIEYDPRTGRGFLLYWGSARGSYEWKGQPVKVLADRIVVRGTRAVRSREDRAGFDSPTFYAEGSVRIEKGDLVLEMEAFFYDHARERGLAIRARGRSTLAAIGELRDLINPSQLTFLESNAASGSGPTVGLARGGGSVESPGEVPAVAAPPAGRVIRADPPGRSPLARQMAFRAEVLRLTDLDHYEGEDLVISSCDFAEPHFAFLSRAATITRQVEGREAAGGDDTEEGRAQYDIELDGPSFSLSGVPIVPVPLGRLNTRWQTYSPIRRGLYSHSSKFGHRAGVDWKTDWLLGALPGADPDWIEQDLARVDLRAEHLSERGFAYGVHGEYGEDPEKWKQWDLDTDAADYYGQSVYYTVDDHGSDRTGPAGAPDFDDDRWWGDLTHRQRIPSVGVVDVEYSEWSDENFLNEYFPRTRHEKDRESLVYFRRTLHDNAALTALYKFRANSFDTTAETYDGVTERLPEGKFFLMEQPVVARRVYTSLGVQAARLRTRPTDEIDVPRSIDDPVDDVEARTRDYGRFDARNEWSVPLGFGQVVRLRPFASARLSAYETGLHPDDHSITRHVFGSGVTASQQWSRVFSSPGDGWIQRALDIRALKHIIVPRVTYASLFQSNVDADRFSQVDEVDAVDDLETVDLSLRNALWARGRGPRLKTRTLSRDRKGSELERIDMTTHLLVDFETSMRWFLQPARDHGGERFSELDLDLTLYPLKYIWVRSRNFLGPDDNLGFLLSDNSVGIDVVRDRVLLTLGERIRDNLGEFYYGRVGLRLSRRYSVDAYYGFDPDNDDRTDIEFRMVRYFHRFALELGYAFDAGEGDNQTFSVNFYPVEMIRGDWERRVRRGFRY